MLVDLNKEDLIRLVASTPLPDYQVCERMENDGLLVWDQTEKNSTYKWNEQWLASLSETALLGIYKGLNMVAARK